MARSLQQRKKRRPALKNLLSVVAAILSHQMAQQLPTAAAFTRSGNGSTRTTPRTASRPTALHFKSINERKEDDFLTTPGNEDLLLSRLRTGLRTNTGHSPMSPLPDWAISRSHLTGSKLNALKVAMRSNGLFTENESLKLLAAIEEAAAGDTNKAAGAAELCTLLVEMTEVGLNALVAAAFHYCACPSSAARERSPSSQAAPSEWLSMSVMEHYGAHAIAIACDSARLTQLESVAASVMDADDASSRVRPDSKDAENLRQLYLTSAKDWRALAIRSTNCLFRLRQILEANNYHKLTPEITRISREALHIYAPLASQLGMHRLKTELEGAAFRILYRRQYETVDALARQVRNKLQHKEKLGSDTSMDIDQSMRRIMLEAQKNMTSILEKDVEFSSAVENFSVTARVKEPYSMWKKMLRMQSDHILQIPDAIALRVVLNVKKLTPDEDPEVTRRRERDLCYYVYKLFQQTWSPSPVMPRFRDYVKYPKPNGYQSLHYTACTEWAGEDWHMEIQVRSGEMHRVAEFGFACHHEYKAHQNQFAPQESPIIGRKRDRSSDKYLRKLQQWYWQQHAPEPQDHQSSVDASPASFEPVVLTDIWQSRVRADRIRAVTSRREPYIQSLKTVQSDLSRDFVFVFLTQKSSRDLDSSPSSSKGKVLALPSGACVLDALRVGGSKTLEGLDRAYSLNGAATSITRQLKNGDVLNVPVVSTVSF